MEVIGTRKVKNTDRSKLVKMEAFIQESHRMGCILPLVAHATHIDTKINGFDVPSNIEGQLFADFLVSAICIKKHFGF